MHTKNVRHYYTSIAASITVLTGLAALPATAQNITSYEPVTEARLLKPEPENWLHYRGNFEGWGYSPLGKITPGNVRNLKPVWTMSTGAVEGHQAPPFVNNGVMFVTTPGNQVLALNAKTGDLIWRYKRELPEDIIQSHPTSRGVGLYENKVFIATLDAFVVALDARTGKVLWETKVDDYKRAYYFTLAPLVAKGKVMVGTSGGEFGIRGYVAALDAQTGKEVWRTYTIPAPGEPGSENVEGRRPLENGRGLRVDHRSLRSQVEPGVLGHRQPGTVGERHAPGRQPVHGVGHRARCRYGQAARLSPVRAQRVVGLGRGLHSASHRLQA
jgi:alcohol dehydrogenase (cytochrome c)